MGMSGGVQTGTAIAGGTPSRLGTREGEYRGVGMYTPQPYMGPGKPTPGGKRAVRILLEYCLLVKYFITISV